MRGATLAVPAVAGAPRADHRVGVGAHRPRLEAVLREQFLEHLERRARRRLAQLRVSDAGTVSLL